MNGRHYIAVPAGTHLLSDAVISSAVLAADRNIPDEAMGDAGAGGSGGANFEFGVDPSLDPELALVRLTLSSHSHCGLIYALGSAHVDGGRSRTASCRKRHHQPAYRRSRSIILCSRSNITRNAARTSNRR